MAKKKTNQKPSMIGITSFRKKGRHDVRIIMLLEKYGCMSINSIDKYTYNNYYCTARRLRRLKEMGRINMFRDERDLQIYYLEEKMKTHEIIIREIVQQFELTDRLVEVEYGKELVITSGAKHETIKADAIIYWQETNKITGNTMNYITMVEVDLTHFTLNKKIELYDKYREGSVKYNNVDFNLLLVKDRGSRLKETGLDVVTMEYSQDVPFIELTRYKGIRG